MVNTEAFTKRLHKIMEFHDLSAAAFADKIDVGRSSISHLLSGRNKPSLDFVMKIVKTFPEVELYWLLNGKGSFPKTAEKSIPPIQNSATSEAERPNDLFSAKSQLKSTERTDSRGTTKEISKIVIFYSDGSFDAFEN